MKWLKAFVLLTLAAASIGLGMAIAFNNPMPVTLSFLQWQLPAFSLGTLVLFVFAAGTVLGLLVNIIWVWRLQAARRRLSKALQQTSQKVEPIQ